MNTFLTLFVVFSIVGIIGIFLTNRIIKENNTELMKNIEEDHIIIHLPYVYKWIGLVCSAFFWVLLVLMFAFPNDTAGIWVGLLFGLFVLLGLFIILATYLWRIHIYRNSDFLVYTSSFGKFHKINYSEIIDYKNGENYIILKTKQKFYVIDNKSTNIEFLLVMLRKNNIKEL